MSASTGQKFLSAYHSFFLAPGIMPAMFHRHMHKLIYVTTHSLTLLFLISLISTHFLISFSIPGCSSTSFLNHFSNFFSINSTMQNMARFFSFSPLNFDRTKNMKGKTRNKNVWTNNKSHARNWYREIIITHLQRAMI